MEHQDLGRVFCVQEEETVVILYTEMTKNHHSSLLLYLRFEFAEHTTHRECMSDAIEPLALHSFLLTSTR